MAEEIDLRFFARLRSALLECPWCGELADIRTSAIGRDKVQGPRRIQAGTFDPLTARWRCQGCGKGGVLGVVLYLTDPKDDGIMPGDWKATLAAAVRLREIGRGRVAGGSWRERKVRMGGRANQVRRGDG